MLNPYELLGVTIDTPKDDIKKIYYQLSLLTHPDKGGNNDDMIALKKAYDFVMREIKNINNSVTIEDLETSFKEFCKTQENSVPLFQDIYAEAFNIEKFNDYFDKHNDIDKNNAIGISANFLSGGYGDMMEKSDLNQKTSEYKDIDFNTPITYQFTNTLAEYKAPKEMQVQQHLMDYSRKEPIDDYSLDIGGLCMTDYKSAFTNDLNSPKTLNKIETRKITQDKNKTLEELVKEREQLYIPGNNDNIIKKEEYKPEYTWSYEGLIDSARNLVKDFFKIH